MVEVSDSKTSHGDRIALVSGTPEQMRSAENLFQAFIMSTWNSLSVSSFLVSSFSPRFTVTVGEVV